MNLKHELTTNRLTLRPLSTDDAQAVFTWASNPANALYMFWEVSETIEQVEDFLSSTKLGYDFAIVLDDAVIGSCGIYPKYPTGTAEMGWIIHLDHHKKGYGSEICAELIRYGFEDLKLHRIFAPCAAANYGSYRVMERNGMKHEATFKKAFWARVDKEWVDEKVYSILAEDYFQKN